MEKKEQPLQSFVVRQTGAAYGVAVFIMVFAAVLSVLEIRYHVREIPLWIYAALLGMFLLGACVWAEAGNRRLTVAGDVLSYRNILGRTVEFSVGDIGHGRAAYHASKGRDYLGLYDREGKPLCRLECSMKNAGRLVWYLHENGIPLDLEKGAEGFAGDIVSQRPVTEGELKGLSQEVYGQMQELAELWQERNERMGAGLEYGFAVYFRGKMGKIEREGLPQKEDLCLLELYVRKDGHLVQEKRKGRTVMLDVPVFYRKKSEAWGDYRLYFNGGWRDGMEGKLQWLEDYLPKHGFVQTQAQIGHKLEKSL